MERFVNIIGAGLAGSQAALTLANAGIKVRLMEMRPLVQTPVHKTGLCAELVCSNSLKSMDPETAAGMLKRELVMLGSEVFAAAQETAVPAGGALAVDRDAFADKVTKAILRHPNIDYEVDQCSTLAEACKGANAVILASGPLTSEELADNLARLTGSDHLAFFDAAAPIVMADSLDMGVLFRQSRYEKGLGDYLNAPMERDEYNRFIDELLAAKRTILHDFESKDLFQACQPIEEVARTGRDAPRFGALKPVGITDPRTGRRPWANVQLRAENREGACYNLVGFQTNLTFSEQARIFRMIPGLENAEFARYGVMHRNTFLDAPRLLDGNLRLQADTAVPVYVAGQLSGTEGYTEAIRSGLHAALAVIGELKGIAVPPLPRETAFGALLSYATNPETKSYQPSHVNFGLMPPLDNPPKQKSERHAAYSSRGEEAFGGYVAMLAETGLLAPQVGEGQDDGSN
ncbi:MAG: methylenetetrahydrofolate--tRNA-(uracil(54)-C(5))-methyltransferase (FADH(2)-oxidizing) TrmFO [Eggerthellaceae bacterium]|nr:methylenetetrahydrofolate--tRNA-(uracil(54)-C(5))-methyltransferase (FADH(2)-oxidizing) TrmFO [Eggerthellaceae bacterium]